MNLSGLHLTSIGGGNVLLEPTTSLDIADFPPVLEAVLERLQKNKTACLYYDLAETPIIDPVYYTWLDALARACRTMNIRMVCIHMQPTAAYSLAHQLTEMPAFDTALDVQTDRA